MTKSITIVSESDKQTQTLAVSLAKHLRAGDILCLFGDLGAGKTTFVKGLAKGMKIDPEEVHSPSYVLMNIYQGRKMSLFHFDLYRLNDLEEIYAIGYDEFLFGRDVSVVEWAERLNAEMPQEYISVKILHAGEEKRKIQINAVGAKNAPGIEKWNHEITRH